MHLADRERFDALLEKLYGGFNMPLPVPKARSDAYFDGLAKMSLTQFARCVERCLGEDGPERIPSVPGIWGIRKKLGLTDAPLSTTTKAEAPDHIVYLSNRLLWAHIRGRGGLGSTGRFVPAYGMVDCHASPELQACMDFKRELVVEFCGYISEGDESATPAEFVRRFHAGLARVSVPAPSTVRMFEEMRASLPCQQPFPRSMGRPMDAAAQRPLDDMPAARARG